MSELKRQFEQVEQALLEGRVDESDEEALDRLVLRHWQRIQKRKDDRAELRQRLARTQAELNQGRKELAEAAEIINQLRQATARLERERDQYLRSLHALLPAPEVTFSEQELLDLRARGVTFDTVLKDLEAVRKGA